MIKIIKEHKWSVLGIVLVGFLLMSPLLLSPYHQNDDSVYHFANVLSLEKSMQMHGLFASPILPGLAKNFGYASHLLYPPMAHTVTALIYHIFSGISISAAFKMVHVLVLILSGFSMYALAFSFHKDKKMAFFASILYMTYPYQLSQVYVRDSLAESFVFIFLPMIFSSFLSLLEGKKKSFYFLFVLGYVGGILSHFTLMIYATILFAVFLLCYSKKIFKKEFIVPFLIACVFVVGISFFYLEPMIEYRLRGGIAVFLPNLMSSGVYYFSLWPWQYFPFSYSVKEVDFYFTTISLLFLFLVIWKRKELAFPKYSKGFWVVFLLVLFLTSKFFFWDILPTFFYMIQFSWRLCVFLGIGMALFASLIFQKYHQKWFYAGSIVLVLLLSVLAIHTRNDSILDKSYDEFMKEGASIGWQHEYLPAKALEHEDYWLHREEGIIANHNARVTMIQNEVPNLVFTVSNIEEQVSLELPRFYYLGYELVKENGEKIPLTENENGFIQCEVSENGTYTLTYPGTKGMQIAKVISIICFMLGVLCSVGCCFFPKKS